MFQNFNIWKRGYMRIFIMRHGEATAATLDTADRQRVLSATGIQQAKQVGRLLEQYLKRESIRLWASPYKRSIETVTYLRTALPLALVGVHEAIATGNREKIERELLGASTEENVCIVGHIPYVNQWVQQWSGIALPFEPADMAVLTYLKKDDMAKGNMQLSVYISNGGCRWLLGKNI